MHYQNRATTANGFYAARYMPIKSGFSQAALASPRL